MNISLKAQPLGAVRERHTICWRGARVNHPLRSNDLTGDTKQVIFGRRHDLAPPYETAPPPDSIEFGGGAGSWFVALAARREPLNLRQRFDVDEEAEIPIDHDAEAEL